MSNRSYREAAVGCNGRIVCSVSISTSTSKLPCVLNFSSISRSTPLLHVADLFQGFRPVILRLAKIVYASPIHDYKLLDFLVCCKRLLTESSCGSFPCDTVFLPQGLLPALRTRDSCRGCPPLHEAKVSLTVGSAKRSSLLQHSTLKQHSGGRAPKRMRQQLRVWFYCRPMC